MPQPSVLDIVPFMVHVVVRDDSDAGLTAEQWRRGSGVVVQYHPMCALPGEYASDEWWVVTSACLVCDDGLHPYASGYVEFFFEVGSESVIRVGLDMKSFPPIATMPPGRCHPTHSASGLPCERHGHGDGARKRTTRSGAMMDVAVTRFVAQRSRSPVAV
jgi:hypothetical protein